MSEWWTYGLSDFLMFSPRTWGRLLEMYNAAIWPMQAVGFGSGLLAVALALTGRQPDRSLALLLASCWAWVAWAFHLRHHATINLAAEAYAAGFALQAILLAWGAMRTRPSAPAETCRRRLAGFTLLALAVPGWPVLGAIAGRPWTQVEIFGVSPDPTVVGTLGLLLLSRRPASLVLWPIPLAWCAASGATQWAMGSPEALAMPAAALVALSAALLPRGGSVR